eukprot:SAG31_NODE_6101_length_2171_cov_2.386583_1_plen_133_part_00
MTEQALLRPEKTQCPFAKIEDVIPFIFWREWRVVPRVHDVLAEMDALHIFAVVSMTTVMRVSATMPTAVPIIIFTIRLLFLLPPLLPTSRLLLILLLVWFLHLREVEIILGHPFVEPLVVWAIGCVVNLALQ